MKTNDKRRKNDNRTVNDRDVFTSSEEQHDYLKVNEKSGKLAAKPTPSSELPPEAVSRRKLFPEPETDKGKKHPSMGV